MDQQPDRAQLPLIPGPWRYKWLGSTWRIYSVDAAEGEAVAIADLVCPSKANAALIAAAPRMLDALLRCARAGGSAWPEVQSEARDIIDEIERASTGVTEP